MKRFFTLLIAIFALLTASAQEGYSIILDQSSFRAVHTDALTGVNIDPIAQDISRNACARLKIRFANMNRAEVDALEIKFRSNTDIARRGVAQYFDNVLILEVTAKPNTRFFVQSSEFGQSNEVTINLEANREYEMEARLNQVFSIVVNSNIEGAEVYLDNNFKGRTNENLSLTIPEVVIGPHVLKVSYGGVSSQQNINVNKNSILFRQNVDTTASEPQYVVFEVVPTNAVVMIDNQPYSLQEGAMMIVLPRGTYNYTVSAAGYHSESDSFTVAGSKVEKRIALKADNATVTLTAPNNAEIWINGTRRGIGSWSGVLASGTYIFEARKDGHKSGKLTKTISSTPASQSYTLPAPTPIKGALTITSVPLMADVALDGMPVGRTPLDLKDVITGGHLVSISKAGYNTYTQTVAVAEDKTTTLNATLSKQTIYTPSERSTTAPTTTTPTPTPASAAGTSSQIYTRPNYGSIVVDGSPVAANVTLDGIHIGTLPLKVDNILVGCHALKISKAGYNDYTQNVFITEGKTTTVNIVLTKQSAQTTSTTTKPMDKSGNITSAPYKVGDYYNDGKKEGVVFEVTADGKHGKIVSMTQSDRGIRWASDAYEQKRLIGADSKSDGAYNMAKVKSISGWQSKYPAFKWCADLGDGWYLPAIDELEKFMLDKSVWIAVSRTLIASGGTALHNVAASTVNRYWSSTEYAFQHNGIFYACNIYMKDGTVSQNPKNTGGEYSYTFVRAVATF